MVDSWIEYEEPLFIAGPAEGMVYFGAQVGHSPAREGRREIDCPVCGGLLVYDPKNPDGGCVPRVEYDPNRHVLVVPDTDPLHGSDGLCSGCMRWKRDTMLMGRMESEYAERGSNDPVPILPQDHGSESKASRAALIVGRPA